MCCRRSQLSLITRSIVIELECFRAADTRVRFEVFILRCRHANCRVPRLCVASFVRETLLCIWSLNVSCVYGSRHVASVMASHSANHHSTLN